MSPITATARLRPSALPHRSPLLSAYLTAAWNDNLRVELKGYNGARLIYDNTYTLSATAPTLITFNYVGVTSVQFISSGGTLHPGYCGSGEHFVMDNVTVVPTPPTPMAVLYSFNGPDGGDPSAALVQGADGNFYGTTTYGGTYGEGTVFRMTTNGTLTTLLSFNYSNGAYPYAGLVQGADGNFYGTTAERRNVRRRHGVQNDGQWHPDHVGFVQLFCEWRLSLRRTGAGRRRQFLRHDRRRRNVRRRHGVQNDDQWHADHIGFLQLHRMAVILTPGWCRAPTAISTAQPEDGGTYGDGTVFRMTTNGTLTTLVSFNYSNGGYPYAGLVQGADGNFYGTTADGGAYGDGTVFRMTTNGTLTTLVSFNYAEWRFSLRRAGAGRRRQFLRHHRQTAERPAMARCSK